MRNRIKLLFCGCVILVLSATCTNLPASGLVNEFLWFKSYDAALNEWNAATLASFTQQIAATRFKNIKNELTNARDVFESSIEGRDGRQNSERMYFLKRAAEYAGAVDSFYVVETVTQGYAVMGYKYLLFDSAGQMRILAFVHHNHWAPIKDSTVSRVTLDAGLSPVVLNFKNYIPRMVSQLVLSKFKKGQSIKSTYLVDAALPKSSPLSGLIRIQE